MPSNDLARYKVSKNNNKPQNLICKKSENNRDIFDSDMFESTNGNIINVFDFFFIDTLDKKVLH